jgi:uncharacterized membrane protein YphA (DoxX/SURF4 family)
VAVFVALASRFGLGAIFASAGGAKLLARADFERAVRGYALLPDQIVGPFSRFLPVVELALGIALLVGVLPSTAAWCAAGLLVLLTGVVAVALARGLEIDCGCSTSSAQTITWRTVARNTLLIIGSLVAASWASDGFTLYAPDSGGDGVRAAESAAILVATVATFTLWHVASVGWRLARLSGRFRTEFVS